MKGNNYSYDIKAQFSDAKGTGTRNEGAGIFGPPLHLRVHEAAGHASGRWKLGRRALLDEAAHACEPYARSASKGVVRLHRSGYPKGSDF